jgi:hypothetical protein
MQVPLHEGVPGEQRRYGPACVLRHAAAQPQEPHHRPPGQPHPSRRARYPLVSHRTQRKRQRQRNALISGGAQVMCMPGSSVLSASTRSSGRVQPRPRRWPKSWVQSLFRLTPFVASTHTHDATNAQPHTHGTTRHAPPHTHNRTHTRQTMRSCTCCRRGGRGSTGRRLT